MIKSKLISLLGEFSKNEIRAFGDFVRSPFFNNENVLRDLYLILWKEHPSFSGKNFTKENVFGNLFPGKKYNDSVLRNTFSKMMTLTEKFLAVKNFTSDQFTYKLFLLNELKSKQQEKLFIKHKSELDDVLEKHSHDEEYFYRKYLIESLAEEFQRITKTKITFLNKKFVNTFDLLSNSFVTALLKVNTSIINSNKNFFGEKFNSIFLDEIESYLNKNPSKLNDNIYIKYYFNSIKLFETDDEKCFFNLREILDNCRDKLNNSDIRNIQTILTNYCYYKINKGELKFIPEQFRLFKFIIETGSYKGDRNFLSHILFMNVVTCGLEAGEFEWVEKFINEYNNELKAEHRENMINFSFALFYYWKNDYSRSIDYASRITTDDLSYKHQIKSLYLKIYFDLNEVQPFYSHIDAYKHFVNNDKQLPEENKNYILNYINYTKRLFELRNDPEKIKFKMDSLRKEVYENKSIINKLWLLRRII